MRRTATGTALALASMAVLTLVLLPVRSHVSIATTALVLIVPVVIGVVTGGFGAGVISVIVGFLVYDFFFIPPYLTLWVGAAQNWVALVVYVVVMLPVARVVAGMNAARAEANRQGKEIRELFGVSHLLVEDQSLETLLPVVVTTLANLFDARQVALFLQRDERLELVASAGEALTDEQLRSILPTGGSVSTLDPGADDHGDLFALALTATGRPVGLLVLSGEAARRHDRESLLVFGNQIALAVERAQLREEALQKRVTEEMARLAKTLVAAVSHDLRAPLSAMKASSSVLADPTLELEPAARRSLATLIDNQTDRLAGLVQNLLDMSRIQTGVLEPRYSIVSLSDLIDTVTGDLAATLSGHEVELELPEGLPPVDVDTGLVTRVLANLLDNAVRYSPPGAPITVRARRVSADTVEVSVADRGPGVSPDRRGEIFELFTRRSDDAGAGLGLTIAKTFIEAHHQRIWVEEVPGGGARFCFTLRTALQVPDEVALASRSHH